MVVGAAGEMRRRGMEKVAGWGRCWVKVVMEVWLQLLVTAAAAAVAAVRLGSGVEVGVGVGVRVAGWVGRLLVRGTVGEMSCLVRVRVTGRTWIVVLLMGRR
jgi:hypothetical protein